MKLRLASFRARIFGLSLLVVGLTLTLVAAFSWTSALSYEVDRMDARLCEEARQLVWRPPRSGDLERLERDAAFKLRLKSADQLLLWVQPASSEPAIRSARWPKSLDLSAVANPRPPDGPGDKPGRPAGDTHRPPSPDAPDGPARDPGLPGAAPREPGAPRRPPRALCEVAGFSALASDWRAAQATASNAKGLVAADLAATRTELRQALASIV